jgi:hypothetical protein
MRKGINSKADAQVIKEKSADNANKEHMNESLRKIAKNRLYRHRYRYVLRLSRYDDRCQIFASILLFLSANLISNRVFRKQTFFKGVNKTMWIQI